MKDKLSRIRSPWRRLLVSLFLSVLVFIGRFKSPRAFVHWVGRTHRPRRLERLLVISLLFVSMLIMEPHQYIMWCTLWGGGVSLFVILQSVRKLIPRKIYHWVNYR